MRLSSQTQTGVFGGRGECQDHHRGTPRVTEQVGRPRLNFQRICFLNNFTARGLGSLFGHKARFAFRVFYKIRRFICVHTKRDRDRASIPNLPSSPKWTGSSRTSHTACRSGSPSCRPAAYEAFASRPWRAGTSCTALASAGCPTRSPGACMPSG